MNETLNTKVKEHTTHFMCGGIVERIEDAPPEEGDHYAMQFRYRCLKCKEIIGRQGIVTEYIHNKEKM